MREDVKLQLFEVGEVNAAVDAEVDVGLAVVRMVLDVVLQQPRQVMEDLRAGDARVHEVAVMLLHMIQELRTQEQAPAVRAFDMPQFPAALQRHVRPEVFEQVVQRFVLDLAVRAAEHQIFPALRVGQRNFAIARDLALGHVQLRKGQVGLLQLLFEQVGEATGKLEGLNCAMSEEK